MLHRRLAAFRAACAVVPVSGLGSWARKNRAAIQDTRRKFDAVGKGG